MTITKLNIVNGIIQDKFIDGIPVKIQIVQPSGAKNVRTLTKMTEVIGITNHNTANTAPTAGDESHAKWLQNVENADSQYVSVHLFVDHDSITQTVPLDEFCYHAGDGSGNGNRKTIAIEICENTNLSKAEENAKKLNAALILTYPHLKIYKHQDWSGKVCPRVILGRKNGWETFVADINAYVLSSKQSVQPKSELSEWAKPGYEFVTKNKISDGTRPKDPVTREEVWAMLQRYSVIQK
jgi:N-acetylmuramoyl-L-alanine amidase